MVIPIIHPDKKLLSSCSRSHSGPSRHKEEERQNNQTCFLPLRSSGPTEGARRVIQYLGMSQVLWWAITGSRDRKFLALALPSLAQVLTPSWTHHQASWWVCPRPPVPAWMGIMWAQAVVQLPGMGLCLEGCKSQTSPDTRPLGEPGQENNLATSAC